MNIAQIEENLQKLIKAFNKESFIYDLLLAYGQPKATIKRIKDGGLNLSKVIGEISWKKKMFFKEVNGEDLHDLISDLTSDSKAVKHDPRFVIVTDYKNLLAVDTKTQDTLDIEILDIAKHFDFFLPWAGMEKAQHQNENPADVRAAEKMAKLYDDIKKDNPTKTPAEVHNLNVFLSRLLFCFFAEDTGIFDKGQFTYAISSHTQQDGSDLNAYLDHLFEVMNTPDKQRNNLPSYLLVFPYVNGGLFRNKHTAPKFNRKSRQSVIDSGELDWSAINPDIFGSMIQAVITPEHRGGLGMHYTSVPNIMKVIEPLFLNELYEEFEAAKGNKKKLIALLNRIWSIKIFDPACGSGNFLIIAYKELRKLEIAIIKEYDRVKAGNSGFAEIQSSLFPKAQLRLGNDETSILQFDSKIKLSQFYGIELDDFAHEVAILSLWLAEHQMNQVFFKEFGRTKPALPLTETGNIVHGNATRLNWETVCPKEKGKEIFILGNPPYLGSKRQSPSQKAEMATVFSGIEGYKNLDYIACWFYIGSDYIRDFNANMAFVTTNSISQGDQVALLWPNIFTKGVFINFAHSTFKWENNAKGNAGVSCVIIGLSSKSTRERLIINDKIKIKVNTISPYLTPNSSIIVSKRTAPLSNIPIMSYGNMPLEGGHLRFEREEKESLIKSSSSTKKFIKKVIGGDEFLQGLERFCLWIEDSELNEANAIPEIKKRIQLVKEFREEGGDVARTLVHKSHQFRYRNIARETLILIPCTSSERREFLQCGFFDSSYITMNSAQVVYDSEPYIFGILSSKMHMLWSKATAGCLESRLRYSAMLCYNTFPVPELSKSNKDEIYKQSLNVLAVREAHSEKTIAQLYDPDKMPDGLREAHRQLDIAVERCYRAKPFETDEERLEYLFKLYEQMIEDEKSKGTLFETESKSKKKKK